jgi:taurine dioxygenase
MSLSSRPLSKLLGIEITGLQPSEATRPENINMLVQSLYTHAVVCIRGMKLAPGDLLNIGQSLGQPIHHNEEDLRLDNLPGVMSLSNADQRDERQLNGGAHWHTDLIHSDTPASFTLLNAVAVPESGGGTNFANQVAAYDGLSPQRRALAESITVKHCYEGRTDGSMPIFEHQLVRPHPVTGRKALYGTAGTGIGIAGMADVEAAPILAAFAGHAIEDRFVYHHNYQLHDLVIWDNSQLLHCADRLQRSQGESSNRVMHRVSVRGWPGQHDSKQTSTEANSDV